jgi:hypothetical protein
MASESPQVSKNTTPEVGLRSLSLLFGRAGAPNILDLGFDASDAENPTLEEESERFGNSEQNLFADERVSHISFGFEGERWRIRNAVWLLAQSKLGSRLLNDTYRAGYRIAFDSMAFANETLGASCNTTDKIICLDSRADSVQLVLLLAEQLTFALNAINGLICDTSLTPAAALLTERLLRADAISATLQVSTELATSTVLPKVTDNLQYLRIAEARFPLMAKAFTEAAISPLAIETGEAQAAAIRAFYRSPQKRLISENCVITRYRALPESVFKDPKFMLIGFNASDITYKFALPGIAYATSKDPALKLSTPFNCGVFSSTLDSLNYLQNIRRNAGLRDKETWALPLVDAAAFE